MTSSNVFIDTKAATAPTPGDLDSRLIATLTRFARALALYGYQVAVHSPKALARLPQVSPEQKLKTIEYFELWHSLIDPDGELEIEPRREIAFAKRALDVFGFHVSESFWSTVKEDHIIEIYNAENLQVYRSLNFFKYCGYSLLDISVFEWFVLWERPRMIMDDMAKVTERVAKSALARERLQIAKHAVREVMSTKDALNFEPRIYLIDFQYMGVAQSRAGEPNGVICTCTAEIVATGSDADKVQFA